MRAEAGSGWFPGSPVCQVESQFCPGIVESPETWWKTRGGLALVRHTWQHAQSGLGGGKVDTGGQAGRHRGGGQGENGAVRGAVRKACGLGFQPREGGGRAGVVCPRAWQACRRRGASRVLAGGSLRP